jgi:hypothetical protein
MRSASRLFRHSVHEIFRRRKFSLHARCVVVLLAVRALVSGITGCASPATPGPAQTATPPAAKTDALRKPSLFYALQRGLTAAQMHALASKPEEIKPFKSDDVLHNEVWFYP